MEAFISKFYLIPPELRLIVVFVNAMMMCQ